MEEVHPVCTVYCVYRIHSVCDVVTLSYSEYVPSSPSGLIKEGKPTALDALQLCSLLLPQTNRTRLHRLLRLIHKASSNRQLVLSKTQSNRDVLLDHFSTVVLRSATHSNSPLHLPVPAFHKTDQGSGSSGSSGKGGTGPEEEKEALKKLVSFMSQHYQKIFKV